MLGSTHVEPGQRARAMHGFGSGGTQTSAVIGSRKFFDTHFLVIGGTDC